MNIELEKSLALPVSAAIGWGLVENIEGIASCMPGAKITERIDDTHYKGTITVKLGPATVSFKGELEVVELDPATRSIHILGKGSDTTGSSAASLDLTAVVKETGPGSCELSGRSAVTVSGKVAAFGSRLMGTVTDQLLKIFFSNLLARAEASKPVASPAEAEPIAAQGGVIAETGTISPPPVEPKFNALAFIWAVVKDLVRGLFGRTKAT